jgi:hypothetical protein
VTQRPPSPGVTPCLQGPGGSELEIHRIPRDGTPDVLQSTNESNGEFMIALGISNTKDQLDWLVMDGTDLTDLQVVEREKVQVPAGARQAELAWFRLELLSLIGRHDPARIGIRMAERPAGAGSLSIGRVEVQGVLLAAAGEANVAVKEVYGASIRSALGGSKDAVEATIQATTVLANLPKTRRDPALAATVAILK